MREEGWRVCSKPSVITTTRRGAWYLLDSASCTLQGNCSFPDPRWTAIMSLRRRSVPLRVARLVLSPLVLAVGMSCAAATESPSARQDDSAGGMKALASLRKDLAGRQHRSLASRQHRGPVLDGGDGRVRRGSIPLSARRLPLAAYGTQHDAGLPARLAAWPLRCRRGSGRWHGRAARRESR